MNVMKTNIFGTNILQRLKTNLLSCKNKFCKNVLQRVSLIRSDSIENLIFVHSVFLYVEITFLVKESFAVYLLMKMRKKMKKKRIMD